MESNLEASDRAFREQFDRGNSQFHRGDPRPVRVGGSRVPESMPSEYAPEQPEAAPPSEECAAVIEARAALLEFKKALSQVPPSVEALVKASALKEESKREAAVTEKRQILNTSLENFRVSKENLARYGNKIPDYEAEYVAVSTGALREFNREEFFDYANNVKQFSQVVFRETQEMLKTIKALKKA